MKREREDKGMEVEEEESGRRKNEGRKEGDGTIERGLRGIERNMKDYREERIGGEEEKGRKERKEGTDECGGRERGEWGKG